MRIAIQQPYFFPYLNYFCLIQQAEHFIFFDNVQYVRHAWYERNRILKPCSGGWQWFMAPLQKHSHTENLINVLINNDIDWQNKIFAQLNHYKRKAPHYYDTMQVIAQIFQRQYAGVIELNVSAIESICAYLGIFTRMERLSQMDLVYNTANAPDEWALNICKGMKGVDQYVNLPGGVNFFDRSKYERAGIDLKFPALRNIHYPQNRNCFEPDLSILDVMMFNSPHEIRQMLTQFTYL